jgi:hypothetical protein
MNKELSDNALEVWNILHKEKNDAELSFKSKKINTTNRRLYFMAGDLKSLLNRNIQIGSIPFSEFNLKQIIQELINVGLLIQEIDGKLYISDPIDIIRQKLNGTNKRITQDIS